MHKSRILIGVCLLIFGTLIPGCGNAQPTSDKVDSPMQGTLELDGNAPRSYGQHGLTVKLWSRIDAPNTTMTITLPSSVTLVKGDLVWKGDLRAKEVHEQQISVNISILTAAAEIQMDALSVPNPGHFWYGRGLSIYIRPGSEGMFDASNQHYAQSDQTTRSKTNPVIEPTKDPNAPTALP